jgi:hypothetical protein
MSISYYHVDAFTDELFGGNPPVYASFPSFLPKEPCKR